MINECGAVDGMTIGIGNPNTRRNPAPVPLLPLKIPYYLTWDRIQVSYLINSQFKASYVCVAKFYVFIGRNKLHIAVLHHT
jgi:hypothetical protein